jgi:ketosteroid isomerase-like protein
MLAKKITHNVGVQLVLVLLLHTATVVLAKDSVKDLTHESVEQSVRQLENERVQALLRGDTAFIERHYADDYMTTAASGLVRKRAEVIADIKSGAIKWESMAHEDVRLRVYGNTVIVTGLDSIKGVDGQRSGQHRTTPIHSRMGEDGRTMAARRQPYHSHLLKLPATR